MSLDNDPIRGVGSVVGHTLPQSENLKAQQRQLLHDVYFPNEEKPELSPHLQQVASRFADQQAHGVDFRHTEDFFHRFMRAAPSKTLHAQEMGQLTRKPPASSSRSYASGRLSRAVNHQPAFNKASNALINTGKNRLSRLEKETKNVPTKMARQLGYERRVPAFAKRYLLRNPMARLSSRTYVPMAPNLQNTPLTPNYYGTYSYRKSFAAWLKLPYNAKHFDHRTTFFPVELLPPPDVDFIPFELYAALGVMVGWQWLVDQCIRAEYVQDRYNSDNLEVFLSNYSLLGIKPADSLQGAVAHYPSEEHLQRMLQYLSVRHRAKARMRIELLNRQGETVSDVWVEYGILKKKKDSEK